MYDTMEWLLKHVPNNNGKAGIYGISYPGFYTSASIIDSHPAIKAASPQAPVTDLYMGDDSYHGGAFMLAANFGFYAIFTEQKNPTPLPKTRDELRLRRGRRLRLLPEAPDHAEHPGHPDRRRSAPTSRRPSSTTPTTQFWQTRDIAPHLKSVKAAVLTVGGWFDAEDPQGPFTTYHAIKKYNPGTFNGLVIGPWVHGGWARYDGQQLGHVSLRQQDRRVLPQPASSSPSSSST